MPASLPEDLAAEASLLVLTQAESAWHTLGASLTTRGPTRLLRLSSDGRRVIAEAQEPGIGLGYIRPGRLLRLAPDPRGYQGYGLVGIEIRASDDLRRISTVQVPLAHSIYELAPVPQRDEALLVNDTDARLVSLSAGELGTAVPMIPLDAAGGCGVPPVVQIRPSGNFVLGGVCVPNSDDSRQVALLDASGELTGRFRSPAEEYDAGYALSPTGERLHVLAPQQRKLWTIGLPAGQILSEEQFDTPLPMRDRAKRLRGPTTLLTSRDGATLYCTVASTNGDSQGIYVLDAQSGRLKARWMSNVTLTGIALSRDGSVLIAVSPQDGGSIIAVSTRDGTHEVRGRGLGALVGVALAGD